MSRTPKGQKKKELAALKAELTEQIRAQEEDTWSGGMFPESSQDDIDWLHHVGKLLGVISSTNAS